MAGRDVVMLMAILHSPIHRYRSMTYDSKEVTSHGGWQERGYVDGDPPFSQPSL